jgi:hypothetical protein
MVKYAETCSEINLKEETDRTGQIQKLRSVQVNVLMFVFFAVVLHFIIYTILNDFVVYFYTTMSGLYSVERWDVS